MTQTTDPFAQPTAPAKPAAPAGDPFGQPAAGGGNYPKPADLIGELVLIKPIKVEDQPKYRGKPGETQERLTADTHVLTGDYAGNVYREMWWTNAPVVKAGQTALRDGTPMVLGRLRTFPSGTEKKLPNGCQTWQEVQRELERFANRERDEKPGYAIGLENYTPEDAETARAYLASKS